MTHQKFCSWKIAKDKRATCRLLSLIFKTCRKNKRRGKNGLVKDRPGPLPPWSSYGDSRHPPGTQKVPFRGGVSFRGGRECHLGVTPWPGAKVHTGLKGVLGVIGFQFDHKKRIIWTSPENCEISVHNFSENLTKKCPKHPFFHEKTPHFSKKFRLRRLWGSAI